MVTCDARVKDRRARQRTLMIAVHEWRELVMDARAHGLGVSKFLLLVWRNWRSSRSTLSVIPELPVDPWKKGG